MKNRAVQYFIIGTFVSLYAIVSIISTIHVIDFFKLSNPQWLAVSLAIAFEVGAAASLASIIALKKMNKTLIWSLFITLTLMQMMGNTYYAYTNLQNYQSWVELFGLVDAEPIFQKRVLALVSGAILPLVALGFIKSLVDYIKPTEPAVVTEPLPIETATTEKEELPEWTDADRDLAVFTAMQKAYEENPPVDNDKDLETASLYDLEEFFREEVEEKVEEEEEEEKEEELHTEEEKREIIQEIRKKDDDEGPINPQVAPGINV